MTRFYYADGRVVFAYDSVPAWQVLASLDGRTFFRRRYALARGYYGPLRDDDWHEQGCTCRGCSAIYTEDTDKHPCVGFANGCACDACYLRGGQ